MAVRGLEEATSRLDQLKRFSGLVLVAAIVAALLVGALILTGVFTFAPVPQVRVFGIVIPPNWTAFLGAFTMALVITLAYVYYATFIRNSITKLIGYWTDLPLQAQAVILALPATAIVGLSLYLSDRYLHRFDILVIVGGAVIVGILVVILTIRIVEGEWTLTEWARSLYMSLLIAGVVAMLTAFVFAGVVPGYFPLAVLLISWAICLYLLLRRRQEVQDSFLTNLLKNTGYAQMRQVDTLTVSVWTGLVVAIVVAAIVGLFGTTPANAYHRVALSVILIGPAITIATSVGWPNREHIDLVISDINVRDSTEQRELTIRNLGNRPIDLRSAKIADAYNTVYHLYVNTTVGAGDSVKVEIPESFELAASDRYPVSSLPFGFGLTKLSSEPNIVTRDGKQYTLIWIDQVGEYSKDESAG